MLKLMNILAVWCRESGSINTAAFSFLLMGFAVLLTYKLTLVSSRPKITIDYFWDVIPFQPYAIISVLL